MDVPSRAPLAQVHATLCYAAPRLEELPHVADLVSKCLDDSQLVSPTRAVASGSLRLFQRVASRLFDASVAPINRDYALAKALEAAIEADNLAIVQAIHALHPQPLDARSLKFSMAHGSVELVQWVVTNRHDRVCCQAGIRNLCRGCVEMAAKWIGDKDTFRIASWLIDEHAMAVSDGSESNRTHDIQLIVSGGLTEAAHAALRRSAELVRWCDNRGLLTDRMVTRLVRDTMRHANAGSAEIVRYFLERGNASEREDGFVDDLIAASCHPNQEALVELVLASDVFSGVRAHFLYAPTDTSGGTRVLQWDREYEAKRKARSFLGMSMATTVAGETGHLATMQWLANERDVTTLKAPLNGVSEQQSLEILQWLPHSGWGPWGPSMMDYAAGNGHLHVVRWLHENQSAWCSEQAMDDAAANGHLHVVQWLHENRSEGCTPMAMKYAAGGGHLAVVKWLYENRREGNVSEAMAYAATNGELDVVRWCLDYGGCARCVQRRVLTQPMVHNGGNVAIFEARPLYPLQLLATQTDRSTAADCSGQCVTAGELHASLNLAAVALGLADLLLAEYLHEHHSELFAWPEDQVAAVINTITWEHHLPAVQWLHAQYPASLNWLQLADAATERVQPEIAQWLLQAHYSTCQNRPWVSLAH